jgi:hypothetical protein
MKNVTKILGVGAILAIPMLGSGVSHAAVVCSAAGLNCVGPANEVVTGIFPADGGFVLLTAPQVPAGTGCTGSSGGLNVKLKPSHALFKETYATVLTAAALNSKVTLRVATGSGECVVKYFRLESGG